MTAIALPGAAAPLVSRILRSSGITLLGFGASQVIRLASNLALTRLLFPEAFGMMAIVSVILMGLAMLSDLGTGPSIMSSPRGDDPAFLDTAWTIQILRGLSLWVLAACASPFVAAFYGEPALAAYLPVAAFGMVIAGFVPTRLETANRHLRAGLVTLVEIGSQVVGIIAAVAFAYAFRSVWALVASGLLGTLAQLILMHLILPGHRNALRWEPRAAHELVHFGKWIFLATLCGFAVGQADKVILARHLDLGAFGLYNIAWFLASFPLTLGSVVTRRVLIPLYRDSPPAASAANRRRIRHMRAGALAALLGLAAALAFGGAALVNWLYDSRYESAGQVVALIAVMQAPALLLLTCDQAALAMGDSRRYFWLTLARAILVVAGLLTGLQWGGLPGAVIGQGFGNLAAYPVLVWLLRPHGAWDPGLDAVFMASAAVVGGLALWWAGGIAPSFG